MAEHRLGAPEEHARAPNDANVSDDSDGAAPARKVQRLHSNPRPGGSGDDVARALEVFSKDFDSAAYGRMTNDSLRVKAYSAAIECVVRGCTVLDLGTGPEALLAILCARAGARRVVAVEVVPAVADKAREAVASAGCSDRVEVLVGHSTHLELPRVDVVVHEIVGNIATEEGLAASLADLQARAEVVDSSKLGWSLPCRVETLAAPTSLSICLPEEEEEDLEAEPDPAVRLPFVPPLAVLLGEPRQLEVVDAAKKIQLEQECRQVWKVASAATFTGFICAPRVVLDGETTLDAWVQSTHWRHILVQLDVPVRVEAGDQIELKFRADLRHFPVSHRFEVAVLRRPPDDSEPQREALEVIDVKIKCRGS